MIIQQENKMNNHNHNHLPEELLINEIFRRLPLRSLLICNCVSKLWNSIISSPYFAAFYLKHSPFSKHQSLLINTKNSFLSFDFEDHENNKVQPIKETAFTSSNVSMVASCNGLICLEDKASNSLYVWNPIISKQIQIPHPETLPNTKCVWGFGQVSSTKDYKLIRIFHENLKPKVQLFSFISNIWKILDTKFANFGSDEIPPMSGKGVSINNMIYWASYYTEYNVAYYDHCCQIVGFDLAKEKFIALTPLPMWCDYGFNETPVLFQRDGCLCACWRSNKGEFDIGMFKEEEEAGKYSWIRLFHFDHTSFLHDERFSFQRILGVTKTGDYVVHVDGESIFLLDLNQDPPKDVHCLRIPRNRNMISYVKSLLSPLELVDYRG